MGTRLIGLATLLLTTASFAADEATTRATERLKQRQAERSQGQKAPATRAEVDDLRKQVKNLSTTVETLRQEIAALREDLRSLRAAQKPAAPPKVAAEKQRSGIAIGMTREELERLIGGTKGTLKSATEDEEIYHWVLPNSFQVVEGVKSEQLGSYTLVVSFRGGKIISFERFDNHDRMGARSR